MAGTRYLLEVIPKLPERLQRLDELANNLWYSWHLPARELFSRLAGKLWGVSGYSPKAVLKRVDQHRLNEAAEDPAFLGAMASVLSAFDTYHNGNGREHGPQLAKGDLIAYFCAEFGFHESLPIYSGGLGILAGDHCKTASDLHLPFVGVGLLYRQGYFIQTIDAQGRQHAQYNDSDFGDLPIAPVLHDGTELHVRVNLSGRTVAAKVWQVQVGRVILYLLDTDLAENAPNDRDIAHRLYGGDRNTRIEQEILLGVGGVRALTALGIAPTVWHINEGHAAFLVLERTRALVATGLPFGAALEAVAATTVFTTHTVVPAGHDHFTEETIRRYFDGFCQELGCDMETLLALGRAPDSADFNMTALAIRGSRYQNGVSRIHGDVSAEVGKYLWPQIEAEENPIEHVTNGVHLPTFLSELWHDSFKRNLGPGWEQRLTDHEVWARIQDIPDHAYWSVRQSIKSLMLKHLRERIGQQHLRNQVSPAHIERILRFAHPDNPNILTIGFARRFATYKRAALLFKDLVWLKEIVTNEKRPLVFVFAGKAHPADAPGQEIIRRIAEVAALPEFVGHILLVEGYDLHLARRLVSGVDVWLNNPVYPLEASGTSGMKAAMNGVINLSVLDGWWGEAWQDEPGEENGWGIRPVDTSGDVDNPQRDAEEARTLYEILQDSVAPLYYARGEMGYSPGWIMMSKRSIASIAPRFNSHRMVGEYISRFYAPASKQGRKISADNFSGAQQLADWKARVRAAWSQITIRRLDNDSGAARRIDFGSPTRFEVAVKLAGLAPEDVAVELLLSRPNTRLGSRPPRRVRLAWLGAIDGTEENRYGLDFTSDVCGKIEYRIRAYPTHELLTHPFELGMMLWL